MRAAEPLGRRAEARGCGLQLTARGARLGCAAGLWLEAMHCGEVWWQETEMAAQIVYRGRRQRSINANT